MIRAIAAFALMTTAAAAQSSGGFEIIDAQPLPSFENDGALGLDNLGDGTGEFQAEEIITFSTPQAQDLSVAGASKTVAVETAPAAVLRGLDKVSGETTDLPLSAGETAALGRISVTLRECRYPIDNPSGDAFAYLTINAEGRDGPQFEGWMIASSPALSALDHPRYDVWVIRCSTS